MKCENIKCGNTHDGTFGTGRFCSRSCANSRTKTDEIKRKVSDSMKLAFKEGRVVPPSHHSNFSDILEKRRKEWERKLLNVEFSTLSHQRLRMRVILEQDKKCNRCGLSEWQGVVITLELEHKDGNNQNNCRGNLEALCPNCHSITLTWRGRNKPVGNRPIVSDEDMVKAYIETGNIRQCLLSLGLAAKGNNYGRVKRALTIWDVPY